MLLNNVPLFLVIQQPLNFKTTHGKSLPSPSLSHYLETRNPMLVTEREMYKAFAPTMPSSSKQLIQKCVSKENQLNQAESSDANLAVKFMFCKIRERKQKEK